MWLVATAFFVLPRLYFPCLLFWDLFNAFVLANCLEFGNLFLAVCFVVYLLCLCSEFFLVPVFIDWDTTLEFTRCSVSLWLIDFATVDHNLTEYVHPALQLGRKLGPHKPVDSIVYCKRHSAPAFKPSVNPRGTFTRICCLRCSARRSCCRIGTRLWNTFGASPCMAAPIPRLLARYLTNRKTLLPWIECGVLVYQFPTQCRFNALQINCLDGIQNRFLGA
jgi:hypothetical protein